MMFDPLAIMDLVLKGLINEQQIENVKEQCCITRNCNTFIVCVNIYEINNSINDPSTP